MDTVKDLFFLHERGFQSGVLGMVFILFSTLAPLITGFLVSAKGWRWYHWLVSILAGLDMILIYFFLPETNFERNLHLALDGAGAVSVDDVNEEPEEQAGADSKDSATSHIEQSTTTQTFVKKSYAQELKPWSTPNPNTSTLWPFIRPWISASFPAVAWSTLSFAAHVSW